VSYATREQQRWEIAQSFALDPNSRRNFLDGRGRIVVHSEQDHHEMRLLGTPSTSLVRCSRCFDERGECSRVAFARAGWTGV